MESNCTLLSDHGNYKLTLKGNGELDIFSAAQYISSSNTANSNATMLSFKNGGNLVLYTEIGWPVWATNTNTKYSNAPEKVDKIVLQNHGNLVMSFSNNEVKWNSGSNFICRNDESVTNVAVIW